MVRVRIALALQMSANERQLEKYYRVHAELIAYMGGICVNCGQIENLEFDHIDPKTKSFDIGKNWSRNRDDILKELQKCQLLCSHCHKEKSIRERAPSHGGWGMYKRGCRCQICKDFVNTYQREYKRMNR